MAAYRRGFMTLVTCRLTDCQEPGSAPGPYMSTTPTVDSNSNHVTPNSNPNRGAGRAGGQMSGKGRLPQSVAGPPL